MPRDERGVLTYSSVQQVSSNSRHEGRLRALGLDSKYTVQESNSDQEESGDDFAGQNVGRPESVAVGRMTMRRSQNLYTTLLRLGLG